MGDFLLQNLLRLFDIFFQKSIDNLFDPIAAVFHTAAMGGQTKNSLQTVFLLVRPPGIEPGTISLKGSRSTG